MESEILETESTHGDFILSRRRLYGFSSFNLFLWGCLCKPLSMWCLCYLNSFAHSEATAGSGILLTEEVYPVKNKYENGYLFSYASNFSTAFVGRI